MKQKVLLTVVETLEFTRRMQAISEPKVIDEFIQFIAENPLKGELIQGTGGARKIRWQKDSHQGKSGGIRIIYYYHDQSMPIFLFTAYAKNEYANISENDKKVLKKIIRQIVECYKR